MLDKTLGHCMGCRENIVLCVPNTHHDPSLPVSWELGLCCNAIPQTTPGEGATELPGELIKYKCALLGLLSQASFFLVI